MPKAILDAAKIPNAEARFPDPPPLTYAIWTDDIETDGPDAQNRIFSHDVTIELYEPDKDDAAETAVEAELNKRGYHYSKQAPYWLRSIQRYQVIYEFFYTEKT